MQALERSHQGGAKQRTPDYLRSHPVTTTRIAEAKTRAAKMENRDAGFTPTFTAIDNPLLPASIKINPAPAGSDAVQFGWVRAHLRVPSANTPTESSAARRVGIECVRPCRSRWTLNH